MADAAEAAVVARSPVAAAPPTVIVAGWEVSARRSDAALRLLDCTALAKVQLRGTPGGAIERALGVAHGQAVRDDADRLKVGSAPGEWLVLSPPGTSEAAARWLLEVAEQAREFHAVVDLTHGRALFRLTGDAAAATLSKLCAVDLTAAAPDGAAFRSAVARLPTDVVRDDRDRTPSYLLACDWSYGRYLFDVVLDAGGEFGIDVAGFAAEPS